MANIRHSSTNTDKNNEVKEFEKLFKSYYKPLCIMSISIVKDMDVAEEIVQGFFYYYWQNRKKLKIKTSLKAYLYKSVYNRSLKHLRALSVRQKHAEYMFLHASRTHSNTLDNLELKEMTQLIEKTLNNLPEKQARIFRLIKFDGLKYKEVAEILSVSVKTVEAAMGKALALLRKNLSIYNNFNL